MLEAGKHGFRLLPLGASGLEVARDGPEVESEVALLSLVGVLEVCVPAGRGRDVVVVDRARDEPFVGGPAFAGRLDASKSTVCDRRERVGNGDRDTLAIRLVRLRVLCW